MRLPKGNAHRRHRLRALTGTAALAGGLVLAAPGTALAAGSVTPFVTCYWPNADGTTTFSVGYTNSGATTITYPVGPLNYVTPSPIDRGQPTAFLAGTHNNAWAPTVTAVDLSNNPNWYVNGVAVSYAGNIPACASKPVTVSGSTMGYLTATSVVVGAGLFVLASPRRRKALSQTGRAVVKVPVAS